jgi:hypothetical protein
LGLKLEGETTVEGPLVGKLIGLNDVRATLAMRPPDGHGGIELDKFHTSAGQKALSLACRKHGVIDQRVSANVRGVHRCASMPRPS